MTKPANTIRLGYAIDSGEPVDLPLGHLCVTGQTQLSGKTTTLEGLIARSGRRAVSFVTKRGEGAFSGGRSIPPYFRERADWVFVASLIDATLGEKNKMLRSFLMKVCRNTKTLAQVHANVKEALDGARGFAESIYTEIDGYLDLVMPQLKRLPPAREITIGPGLNVIDLTEYSTEMQGLVMRSVMEHIYEKEDGVICIVPEAWEFLPQARGSPVTLAAEELIRKGAVLGNYLWIDSQDLSGINARIRKSVSVWILGVQRESNEVKRTIAHAGQAARSLAVADITLLERGQFWACFGRHAIKTYVQPEWMDEKQARAIAMGQSETPAPPVRQKRLDQSPMPPREVFLTPPAVATIAPIQTKKGSPMSKELEAKIDHLTKLLGVATPAPSHAAAPSPPSMDGDEEALYQRFKSRLMRESPDLLRVLAIEPLLEVEITRETIQIDGTSLKGRLAQMLQRGWFAEPKTASAARKELARTGPDVNSGNLSRDLNSLVKMGFLTDEADGYKEVARMKSNIHRKGG